MNYPAREDIWANLFARFQAVLPAAGFRTVSRRLKHWNDVDKALQPYFCMAQGPELLETNRGIPTKHTLTGSLYIYARTDGDLDPGPIINPLMDAVEAVFDPGPVAEALTLDGLVHWCRLDGAVETDEGTLGPQSVVIFPVSIFY